MFSLTVEAYFYLSCSLPRNGLTDIFFAIMHVRDKNNFVCFFTLTPF